MKSQLACVLRITDIGTRITNCDVIDIRNIITSEGTIREIKRSPDTMKAAAILVIHLDCIVAVTMRRFFTISNTKERCFADCIHFLKFDKDRVMNLDKQLRRSLFIIKYVHVLCMCYEIL